MPLMTILKKVAPFCYTPHCNWQKLCCYFIVIIPVTVTVIATIVNLCIIDYIPDACLHEIAKRVGNDWRRLANQLRISVSHDRAELAVLRAWRDRQLERPSEGPDRLRRALLTLRRTDLLKVLEFYARDVVQRPGSVSEGPKLVSTV